MADEVKKEEKVKKSKKLAKVINGSVVTITESVTKSTMTFDVSKLPAGIQANLAPYGLSQKLGDAAAGKEGKDAVDSIQKVWDGLLKGDWSVRVPAAEKITKSSLLNRVNAMPEGAEKAKYKALLEKLFQAPAAA